MKMIPFLLVAPASLVVVWMVCYCWRGNADTAGEYIWRALLTSNITRDGIC